MSGLMHDFINVTIQWTYPLFQRRVQIQGLHSNMTTIAISQSNYLPWKGYFDLIQSSDIFVFYDSVQYTKNDWRNRNVIKTSNGLVWLTVPVHQKSINQTINSIEIAGSHWAKKHWKAITQSYSKSMFFNQYSDYFADIYSSKWLSLSELNQNLLMDICKLLGIEATFIRSESFQLHGDKNQRIIQICKELEADTYLSGPAAKSYIEPKIFEQAGVELKWMDYSGYIPYQQLYGGYESFVSILDLLFNEGPNAIQYIKGRINDPI
jgi:hypothetical protein